MEKNTFQVDIRVYYEDTDAGGVVYYANYLRYFERARTEFLRAAGIDAAEWARKARIEFAVADAKVYYKAPAKLGDMLSVEANIEELGGAYMVFGYTVRLKESGRLFVEGSTKLVCLDEDFKPRRIPAEISDALAQFIRR